MNSNYLTNIASANNLFGCVYIYIYIYIYTIWRSDELGMHWTFLHFFQGNTVAGWRDICQFIFDYENMVKLTKEKSHTIWWFAISLQFYNMCNILQNFTKLSSIIH